MKSVTATWDWKLHFHITKAGNLYIISGVGTPRSISWNTGLRMHVSQYAMTVAESVSVRDVAGYNWYWIIYYTYVNGDKDVIILQWFSQRLYNDIVLKIFMYRAQNSQPFWGQDRNNPGDLGQYHGPLTRYVKLRVAHASGMPGTIPTCITARA